MSVPFAKLGRDRIYPAARIKVEISPTRAVPSIIFAIRLKIRGRHNFRIRWGNSMLHLDHANSSEQIGSETSLDLALASGWRTEPYSGFVETIGAIWARTDEGMPRFGFLAQAKHLNRNGTVHGGMLLSLLDHAFGMSVIGAVGSALGDSSLATIQFGAQFLGAARAGDFVETYCMVLRRTRSLVFLRGECRVRSSILVAGDGVFKILKSGSASKLPKSSAA